MPFKTFTSGEILTASDVNVMLARQAIAVFDDAAARTAAIASPVEGQFSWRKDDSVLEYWNGSSWEEFVTGEPYATVSDTPTGSYTDGGVDYAYWTFTSNGTLTVTEPGLLDILCVGGGGGGARNGGVRAGGGGGGVRYGVFHVDATTHSVTVGASGSGHYNASAGNPGPGGQGGASIFGSVLRAGGGQGGWAFSGSASSASVGGTNDGGSPGGLKIGDGDADGGGAGTASASAGISLNYTGSSVTYAAGGSGSSTSVATANTGNGGNTSTTAGNNNGGSGVVVVRVRVE
jgi:hypothetical protein